MTTVSATGSATMVGVGGMGREEEGMEGAEGSTSRIRHSSESSVCGDLWERREVVGCGEEEEEEEEARDEDESSFSEEG